MQPEAAITPATWIDLARCDLESRGYTIVPADAVVAEADRHAIASSLFADDRFERDDHPWHDRVDTLHFAWHDEVVSVWEAPDHHRPERSVFVQLADDASQSPSSRRRSARACAALHALVEATLRVVPLDQRRPEGALDLHMVRTHGVVASWWHRHGTRRAPVDWVTTYVVSKTGWGGRSQLARDRKGRRVVVECELAPGQLLMHCDGRHFHNVTSLEPTDATPAPCCDAIVITIAPRLAARPVACDPAAGPDRVHIFR